MSSALDKNWLRFANMAKGLILDCGCRTGLWRETLESKGDVIGVDVNREYLEKSLYVNVVLCSITHLPFKNRVFDFVWACAVIEHVKNDCVEEIMRVGKHIVITTPNIRSPLNVLNRLLGRGSWFSSSRHPRHVRAYEIKELKKYGRVYGCSCGLPKRSFWLKIFPMRFWILFPSLSHSLVLEIVRLR
jgi:ubiquinone/menaquinone biosynthesis C-methylase UbiE